MTTHKLLVFSDALSGRDDEFNDWYNAIHLDDVLAVSGVVAAQRFKIVFGDKWKYLAIYELDCADPQAIIQEIGSRAGTDRMQLTDAFDIQNSFMCAAEPLADRRTR